MKKAIICVDDEKFILMSLKRELENNFGNDFLIESAVTGEDAFDLFNELIADKYKVVICIADYIMPGMKGDKLLELIHEKSPDTKTIMLTGQATTEGIKNAVNKAGLYRFMTKPWNNKDLEMTLNEAIKSYYMNLALEQQRQELEIANKKLMKLDKSKNYFIGLLSHELNTPLSGIKGFTELIRATVEDIEITEYCGLILQSTDRLKKFSEYSLLITSLLNEKYGFTYDNESLALLTENVLFKSQEFIDAKQLLINKNFKLLDVYVNIDPNLIEKVIEIILNNAIRFSKPGGKITISDNKTKEHIQLIIKDSGPGFTEDYLNHVFELFISDELMFHSEGYGLGLAMVNIIMQLHNGSIAVRNRSKGGAEVKLSFQI